MHDVVPDLGSALSYSCNFKERRAPFPDEVTFSVEKTLTWKIHPIGCGRDCTNERAPGFLFSARLWTCALRIEPSYACI